MADAIEEGRKKAEKAEKARNLMTEAREGERKKIEEADKTMRRLVAEAQTVAKARVMKKYWRSASVQTSAF